MCRNMKFISSVDQCGVLSVSYLKTSMYCSVYYIKIIALLPHKYRAVYSNAFHNNNTCEIIMNNHTCEIIMSNYTCKIIDIISGEKSINHSILYNKE